MKSQDTWVRQVKRRLERAGFKVRFGDPARAIARKKAARRRDLQLLAAGQATPDEIQKKNSFFGGRQKKFRIVDYGGLNDEA